jgi:predicted CopG family antitoxin
VAAVARTHDPDLDWHGIAAAASGMNASVPDELAPSPATGGNPRPFATQDRRERLFSPYIRIYSMVKTIRVSEEYHEWLTAHKRDDETMEETLRRMTRGPNPDDVAGLLTAEEAEEAKEAIEGLRGRDRDRFDAATEAFERGDESPGRDG